MKSDLSHIEEFRSTDPNPIIDKLFPKGPGQGLFEIPINGMIARVSSNIGKDKDGKSETDHICVSIRSERMGIAVREATDEELEVINKMFWDDSELELIFKYDSAIKPFGHNNTIHLQKRKHNWETI